MTVIANGRPVPTPEEMAEILGMSAERLAAIRRIMNTPVRSRRKATKSRPGGTPSTFTDRSSRKRGQKEVR